MRFLSPCRKYNLMRIAFSSVCSVLLLLSAASYTAGQDDADDDDVVIVDSSLVVLNVSVKDKTDKHVKGLKQQDFEILEDGVRQPITHFSVEDTPFAAVILIDTSGSMENVIDMARAAAIRFLDGLRPDDNVAIYRFDSRVSLVQEFSNSRDIHPAIFDVRSYGNTSMYDAIYKAAGILSERPEKRRAIIVLSDGADNQSGRSSDAALKAAMDVNASVYTIDMMGENARSTQALMNRGILRKFADRSGGTFVSTPGGVRMRDALESIVEELGVQYTLGYAPLNEKKDGKWRNIKLNVARPGLKVRTRKGYTANKESR